jgi:hypothetical protein
MDKGKAKKTPQKLVVALLLAAGALMLLLGVKGENASASATDTPDDLQAYCAYLEKRAEALAESVYGVSDVKVVVTLEGGAKKVYAVDADGKYLVLGSGSSAHLAELCTDSPRIAGIGITCRGGENEAVCNELTALLSAAFGIGMNKIYISPSD